MSPPLRILVVAGEPSGDLHGAALIRALQEQTTQPIIFRGIGGDAMAAAGVELLYHTDQTAVMGVFEILKNISFFKKMLRRLIAELNSWQPDLILTIDYPGFNLRLATAARKKGFHTIHYISPKVWAWNSRRIPRIARAFNTLLTIFPFETDCYQNTGLPIVYVGNPLVDRTAETLAETPPRLPWADNTRRLALLPGSRRPEIERIFPDMLRAAAELDATLPDGCTCVVPTPNRTIRDLAERVAAKTKHRPARLHFVDGQTRHVLHQAEAAIVASGTATLEACLMRCPTLLVYRMHPLTATIARLLVHGTKYAGLANIIAQRCNTGTAPVMPELLQEAFTPKAAANYIKCYLTDPTERERTLTSYDDVIKALGPGGVSIRAAAAILTTLTQP
ncbi:MAG: lipid-A-disaccharide synthase [Lentisphaerae bacterium]|nr:lipid-A-disaccharide synthase [Lentisphaerota bacterium]